ncbi:MAG TPA: RebB family R body protein [bacterium]|nr:RebB family R body protein [bacterium]
MTKKRLIIEKEEKIIEEVIVVDEDPAPSGYRPRPAPHFTPPVADEPSSVVPDGAALSADELALVTSQNLSHSAWQATTIAENQNTTSLAATVQAVNLIFGRERPGKR